MLERIPDVLRPALVPVLETIRSLGPGVAAECFRGLLGRLRFVRLGCLRSARWLSRQRVEQTRVKRDGDGRFRFVFPWPAFEIQLDAMHATQSGYLNGQLRLRVEGASDDVRIRIR